MTRLFYFSVCLVCLTSCFYDSPREKNIDITIDIAQSYKYDLKKGVFTVHFIDRPDTGLIFHLSFDETSKIIDKYYELKIDRITGVDKDLGTIFIEDNCMVMPKLYTILHIRSKTITQDIQIDEGCDDYTFNGDKRANSVKQFLQFIETTIKSRPEIKNAPRSNVVYM